MNITKIECTVDAASLALNALPDEIRLSAIYAGDGIEIPEEHATVVASAVASVSVDLASAMLTSLKALLVTQINAEAEAERKRYITAGEGQAMTYTEKLAQARAFLAANSPTPSDYPMIANEVGITAATAVGVAEAIIAAYTAWAAIGAAIEKTRMEANKAMMAAADTDAARAIRDNITWPTGG